MRGVNAQAAAMQGTMGRVAGTTNKVIHPYNRLNDALVRNKVGMRELATVARDTNGVWAHNQRLMRSTGQVTYDAAGNARVMTTQMGDLGGRVATTGARMRLFNTYLHSGSANLLKWGKNMQWAGRQLMVGFTLPLVLFGRAASKAAEQYDKEMTKIVKVTEFTAEEGTKLFDLQVESVERQTEAIVELGATMGFAAQETASAVAEFAQMGYIGNQLDVLADATLRFSRISGTELSTSIDLTRLTAQAFNTELQDLNGTFAKLNLIENNTALSMEELADSLPVVAGVAANLGLEVEKTAGLMAIMKENGIAAREGATALRTGLVRIVQEATIPAREAFEGIGLDLVDMQARMNDAAEGGGDVMYFLEELGGHLNDLQKHGSAAQGQINQFVGAMGKLVGTRQAARFLALLGEIPEITQDGTLAQRAFMGATTETAQAMRVYNFELERVQNSAAGIAERLRAEINVEMARLGESFLEVANKAMRFARDFLRWFNDLSDGVRRTVLGLGGFLAVLGPVIMLTGLFANAVANILKFMTVLLPKSAAVTEQTVAESIAFDNAARSINMTDVALQRHLVTLGRYNTAAGTATATTAAGTMTGVPGHRPAASKATGRAGAYAAGGAAAEIIGGSGKKAAEEVSDGMDSMAKRFGRSLKGVGKTMGGKITAALLVIPNVLSKMMTKGGIAGKLGMGGMLAGGVGVKAASVAKTVGSALAGPWAAVAAVIAGIPILADPQAFFAGFKEQVSGAFGRFMDAIRSVKDAFSGIIASIQNMGADENSGLSKIANILGHIAGFIGGRLLDVITWVVNLVHVIVPVIEFIMHLVSMIGSLLRGDLSAALSAFEEAWKAVARFIVNLVATLVEGLGKILSWIPGLGGVADAASSVANEMRNWDAISSDVNSNLSYMNELLKGTGENAADLAKRIEEGKKFEEELLAANINVANMTDEEIENSKSLTDEMRHRILVLRAEEKLRARILRAEERARQMEENPDQFSDVERMRQREYLNSLASEGADINEDIAHQLGLQYDETGKLVDAAGDALKTWEDIRKEQEDIVNKFMNEFKGQLSSERDAVASAVTRVFEQEKEQAMEVFDVRMNNIKEEFEARSEALSERLEREKDNLSEVHDTRMEEAEERQAQEMERLEERRQRERDAIEEAGQARVDALKQEEAAQTELERQRERAFEREKARIDYLQGKRTGNIELQLALARGELSSAAIIQEQLASEGRQFRLDTAERERGWTNEDEERRRQRRIETIESETDKRIQRFDEETDRQKEALNDQQEAYIEMLDAQNKAQERAMEKRHKALEDNLKKEQKIAEERIKTEKEAAEEGYEARERAIERTLDTWKNTNAHSEAEYQRHLNELKSDLKAHGGPEGQWRKIVKNYSDWTEEDISEGFRNAARNAQNALGKEAKWDDFAAAMVSNFASGVTGGINNSLREVAEMFGVRVPDPQPTTDYPASANYGGGGTRRGGIPVNAHTGKYIDKASGDPSLQPDETRAILQRGEYVVNRKAVKKLGVDYLERLNQAHKMNIPSNTDAGRFHTGGEVDWEGRFGNATSPKGYGKLVGRYMSYLAQHGATPGGFGARGMGNMEAVSELIPPDNDATWRMSGGWSHGLDPRVARITASILNAIPGGQTITSAFRPGATVLGTGRRSQHSTGMAVDIGALAQRMGGTPAQEREGDMIAQAFRNHPNAHQVIWKSMTGGNHYNHVHAGFRFHDGGLIEDTPDFRKMDFGNDMFSGIMEQILGGFANQMTTGMLNFLPYSGGQQADASGPIKQYAKNLMANYGWPTSMWNSVNELVQHESSWRPTAQNPTSSAYGLFQFLDATWAGAGGRKTSDPYEQIRLGYNYIRNRYNNPDRAWDFWQRNNWYHEGGPVRIPQLARGADINYNDTLANLHKGERVLTSDLSTKLDRGIDRIESGDTFGDTHIHIGEFHGTEDNIDTLVTKIEQVQQKRSMQRGQKRRFG